jgi:lipopolysaccharide transport system ATP-binding protein
MSDAAIINVYNITKSYKLYDSPSDRVKEAFHPFRKKYHHIFNALNSVSFNVKKGEALGIIGRNGSGKSTLLQIISGILQPTLGTVEVNGRISALLELGTGFNPEFLGRENVYINGSILGLSKAEIDERYESILGFADIGDFIEQPVKTYSSGMVLRLAFAVAINVDPQILVVDEALSVGDELFQRKCFSRIEQLRKNGTTILFVSHSGSTVVELCDKVILLDTGELIASGIPKKIVGKYQKLLFAPEDKRDKIRNEIKETVFSEICFEKTRKQNNLEIILENTQKISKTSDEFYDPNLNSKSTITYESHGATIELPKILNTTGKIVNCLIRGEQYRFAYQVRFEAGAFNVRFGMLIKTITGFELGGGVTASNIRNAISYMPANSIVGVEFSFRCHLNPGTYFLNSGVIGTNKGEETFLHRLLDASMFKVMPCEDDTSTGIFDFNCLAAITFLNQ